MRACVVMANLIETTKGSLRNKTDLQVDKNVKFMVKVINFLVRVRLATVEMILDVLADLQLF